ncbi:FAD/NAD(P)-binding domain-containing protein [Amniculicola lignicola CBS 123094]|uniref:FAD/NAD(P)-binding domain-containing protein n=1 Tax=Amniculicola lignicola CBS 123094 TaxID=1392246 RepID=A0A6A5W9E5_9PLEO|nr:FAD/NAD(P)-binding domain-containing protein [Amniculicola lignicola CBS 123094]
MSTVSKKVVIIGGSIAGLLHGVVLKSLGYDVCIAEARHPDQLKAQAAGLSLGPSAQSLMETFLPGLDTESYSMSTTTAQFVAADGAIVSENRTSITVVCSTWGLVFEHLKREFLKPVSGSGEVQYLTGTRATSVQDTDDVVTVTLSALDTELVETLPAHLVIVADGAYSTIRNQLTPGVEPKYAGIIAWGGYIPESRVPPKLNAVFDGKLLMLRADGSYIITYLTPGPKGNAKGDRLLDWVWYDKCDIDSQDFSETMTDRSGRKHRVTVPRGDLSEVVWAKRVERARTVLSSPWVEMVTTSESPFVTAITNSESDKAVFFGGKLLLAGDAFIQFRPHLGSSCNLPVLQALTLLKEDQVLSHGKEFAMRSIAAGQFGMTGTYPEGYVPLYAMDKAGQTPA